MNPIRCKGQLGLDAGYVKRMVTTPERAKTHPQLRQTYNSHTISVVN